MKKCPACNEEYGDGATYCEKCGTKLVKYCICPHCGAEAQDDAVFCPKCGKALDSRDEPTSENIVQEVASSRKVDSKLIEQYKKEIAIYRARKTGFIIAGSILLSLGVTLFIVFIALLTKKVEQDPNIVSISTYYLYLFLIVVFELMADAGIALLIIQAAVFNKKISNREQAIRDYGDYQ